MSVKKAVILAGGWGTRFLPATISVAKEMFPIVDKPIMFYHLKECVDSGITDCLIIFSKTKKELKEFIFPNKDINKKLAKNNKLSLLDEYNSVRNKLNIKMIYQKKMTGSAGAVNLAKKWLNGDDFVLFYGDDLFTSDVPVAKMLINENDKTGKSVCILNKVKKSEISRYGSAVLEERNGTKNLVGIIEKPKAEEAPSLYAVVGRYLLTNDIFNDFNKIKPKNGELYLTDAICEQAKNGKCAGVVLKGKYHDCGNKLEYAKCITDFTLKNSEFGKDYLQYLKEVVKKEN